MLLDQNGIATTPPRPATPSTGLKYVFAGFAMVGVGIIAILIIFLARPGVDNTQMIVNVLGFISTITLSLFAYLKSEETKASVNGQLHEFIKAAKAGAFAQGLQAGKDEEQAKAPVKVAEKVVEKAVVKTGEKHPVMAEEPMMIQSVPSKPEPKE